MTAPEWSCIRDFVVGGGLPAIELPREGKVGDEGTEDLGCIGEIGLKGMYTSASSMILADLLSVSSDCGLSMSLLRPSNISSSTRELSL